MRKIKKDTAKVRGLAQEYAIAASDEKLVNSTKKRIGQELLGELLESGRKTVSVDVQDKKARIRVKRRETHKIDEDKLKKTLGAKLYNKLTSPALDEAKLEAAISLGDVDANDVAACTEFSDTPYLEVRFKDPI